MRSSCSGVTVPGVPMRGMVRAASACRAACTLRSRTARPWRIMSHTATATTTPMSRLSSALSFPSADDTKPARPARAATWLIALAFLAAGCAQRAEIREPGDIPVYVISHGWHAGLALRSEDIDFARWRPLPDAGGARYLEIGWGDRDYYPAPGFNPWYAIKAIAWPTPSVLHVTGFDEPPGVRFPQSDVVELRLARPAVDRLLARIARSFEPGAVPLGPALYGRGAFHPSREEFHLFRMCNAWVAEVLREAGVEARPALLPGGLLGQLRRPEAPGG